MKRYGDLYPQLITFENLYLAYHKATKGKRGQPNVAHQTQPAPSPRLGAESGGHIHPAPASCPLVGAARG